MSVRLRQKPGTLAAAVLVGIAVAWVVLANQSATPYSIENIGTAVVVGAALGGIYAVIA